MKHNIDFWFCGTEDESPEHVTSNWIAITEIHANYLVKDLVDAGEMPSRKPSHLLQFIKALRLYGKQESSGTVQLI